MKLTGVQKLARVLRVMVIAVFICNIAALVLVPGMVMFFQAHVRTDVISLGLRSLHRLHFMAG